MTVIRDGQELSIDIPEGTGACFTLPASVGDSVCAQPDRAAREPPTLGRLVAEGELHLEGAASPARFALRFTPDVAPAEPTQDAAREFASREAAAYAGGPEGEGGASDATVSLPILAVGSSPVRGAVASDVVSFGGARLAHAAFDLDLRERGHDTPIHVAAYAAWSREGLYVLSAEGDSYHAGAVDAFAEQAARTLQLRDPAPPAPADASQVVARLELVGLIVLVLFAVTVAVLGTWMRRARGS